MNSRARPATGSVRASTAASTPALTPTTFAERYESAFPALWCIAAAVLGDRAGADDVVQEAAIAALGKLEQFDPDTSFLAWMGRFVRFRALNALRSRLRRGTDVADPATLDASIASRATLTGRTLNGRGDLDRDQSSFADDVVRALNELEETARICLLLRVVLDIPYREIALGLDIPEGTAMSHVHRARATLRERLASHHAHRRAHGDSGGLDHVQR